jgi:hypothetical protein
MIHAGIPNRRRGVSPNIVSRSTGKLWHPCWKGECGARIGWPLSCICKNMPDEDNANCIRGCLMCIYQAKKDTPNAAEHDACIKLCCWPNPLCWKTIYEQLDLRIHCCANKHGIVFGPGTGEPPGPGKPRPRVEVGCDQCGSHASRPIDCSPFS